MGHQRSFVKLLFRTVRDLLAVRRELLQIASKNKANLDALDTFAEVIANGNKRPANGFVEVDEDSPAPHHKAGASGYNPSEWIIDVREYDVPYYLRVAIDLGKCLDL